MQNFTRATSFRLVSRIRQQDGQRSCRARHPKVHSQQDQVKRFAEVEMVLSDVQQTVPRRKRLQVSHDVGVSSTSTVAVRRQCGPLPERVQLRLLQRILVPVETTIRHKKSESQQGVSRIHFRPNASTHECNSMDNTNWICQVAWKNRYYNIHPIMQWFYVTIEKDKN